MIKSLINKSKTQQSLESLFQWIQRRNQEVDVHVEQIPFTQMKGWTTDADGCIRHESGKFFSIEGMGAADYQPAGDRIFGNTDERDGRCAILPDASED